MREWRRAVPISTVIVSKPCLFAGPGELPHAGSKAVVFSGRPGRADHRLMRGSCVQHLTMRLNVVKVSDVRFQRIVKKSEWRRKEHDQPPFPFMRQFFRFGVMHLETMMTERGVAVDHSTIYRWVQRFAPEMEKRLRWQWRRARSGSWRVAETYVRVRGKWAYLYRAVDKFGDTIDFYLSATRNTKAAKRFLGKALRGWKDWELPEVLNTDKVPTYAGAIAELKAEGKCSQDTRHRQVKYLNNVVEADHGKLKLLIRPVHGFKTLKTAYATIKDFEVMRALRKGQARVFALQDGIVGEARIVERAFGVGPCALSEAIVWLQDHLASAET